MTASESELRAKVAEIIKVPRRLRLLPEENAIRELRSLLHSRMRGIVDNAEHWDRDLTDEESAEHAELQAEFDSLS